MIVADASWVIALRDPLDPHHERAAELAAATSDEHIVLHPLTLAECLVSAARLDVLDHSSIALRAAFDVPVADADAPERWAALRAATGLRLPDVIVLDTAIVRRASSILSFDEQLLAAATDHGVASV